MTRSARTAATRFSTVPMLPFDSPGSKLARDKPRSALRNDRRQHPLEIRPDVVCDRSGAVGIGMRAVRLHQARLADDVEENERHERHFVARRELAKQIVE